MELSAKNGRFSWGVEGSRGEEEEEEEEEEEDALSGTLPHLSKENKLLYTA